MTNDVLLDVTNMSVSYYTRSGVKRAVSEVTFQIFRDEVFGLVGESGSGKSTLCYGLLRLVPPPGRVDSGQVILGGVDITDLKGEDLRRVRWRDLSFIPQGAMSSLNPVVRVFDQMADVVLDHESKQSGQQIEQRVYEALERVNLPRSVARKYPHELSGGMKQRVCIALAMILHPQLILADEPTSALDVISQRLVLEMLSDIRRSVKASMILVGHDMALQAQLVDRLGIMYGGRFMEIGTVQQVFENPLHPYTRRLISSIPSIQKQQDIRQIARSSFTEQEKSHFLGQARLLEVEPGHFVATSKDSVQMPNDSIVA